MHDLPAPPGPPPAPTTPRPPGLVGRIFLDRERRPGLGWRLLSYLTLVMATIAGVSAVIAGGDPPVGRNLLAHLVAVALAVAITWLYRRQVDRRSRHDLGLPPPGRRGWWQPALASAWGCWSSSCSSACWWRWGWARVDGGEAAERGVAAVVALLAAGLVMYTASALVQELAFRGYLFQNLAERLSTRTAAIVAGLIFAALHLLPVDDFSPTLALVVMVDFT